MSKGLAAESFNLALAFALGLPVPATAPLAGALAVGSWATARASCSSSLCCGILEARTAAHFSTAPFIGAAIAIFALGRPFTVSFGAALILMVATTLLVLTQRHEHEHTH